MVRVVLPLVIQLYLYFKRIGLLFIFFMSLVLCERTQDWSFHFQTGNFCINYFWLIAFLKVKRKERNTQNKYINKKKHRDASNNIHRNISSLSMPLYVCFKLKNSCTNYSAPHLIF